MADCNGVITMESGTPVALVSEDDIGGVIDNTGAGRRKYIPFRNYVRVASVVDSTGWVGYGAEPLRYSCAQNAIAKADRKGCSFARLLDSGIYVVDKTVRLRPEQEVIGREAQSDARILLTRPSIKETLYDDAFSNTEDRITLVPDLNNNRVAVQSRFCSVSRNDVSYKDIGNDDMGHYLTHLAKQFMADGYIPPAKLALGQDASLANSMTYEWPNNHSALLGHWF